jgi:hypothetical protein
MRSAPWILMPALLALGCNEPTSPAPASSTAPIPAPVPSNDPKKVDVKVRTPGVTVDVHKPSDGKTDVQVERKSP